MSYKVIYKNYIENDISTSNETVDNITVFTSFSKAKKKIIDILRMERIEINARIRDIKKLEKSPYLIDIIK